MLNKVKVPMPSKKIYTIKRNGKIYVYYIDRAYRNEKGQPTCDSTIIGKKDEETNMLIPNDNYFNYFECDIIVNIKGEKTHETK